MPYNPLARWPITGTWADHMSYSLGGEDYPTPYGTRLGAPAAGSLRNTGGSGEFKAGWVGTAGRRSILELDTPIGDVVAVVMQHQSTFMPEGHYWEGDTCFITGASASGLDWGGDVHAHIHCLTAGGARRRFTDYFTSSSRPAGGDSTLITNGATIMSATHLKSPLGETLVIDGIIAVGDNTPDEFANLKGAELVEISAAQHRSFLAAAAHRDGLPLIVYVEGEQGVYIREGGKLSPLQRQDTLAELHKLGAPYITITPGERDAWL